MIAGSEQAEQAHGKCVRAGSDLRPHDGRLGPEQLRVDALQRIAALVVVAIPVGRVEMPQGDLLLRKKVQYSRRMPFFTAVEFGKLLFQGFFTFREQRGDIYCFNHIYHSFDLSIMLIISSYA